MSYLYQILVSLAWFLAQASAPLNKKLEEFVKGRKNIFKKLEAQIKKGDQFLWMHAASLGEFEQGLPVLKRLKSEYPNHKLLLTFFSPSGYSVRKDSNAADVVAYLPVDTKQNVRRFLDIVQPKIALFIKYEVWPNYMQEITRRKIPSLLFSAIFNSKQIYFKDYGKFMLKALNQFSYILAQDQASMQLLKTKGITHTAVGGDTRFDRVFEILKRDNHLDFMAAFKNELPCLVAGSTWPEGENLLIEFLNTTELKLKLVIAPHTISASRLAQLKKSINRTYAIYSDLSNQRLEEVDVLIIDTIGLLTKLYSYADFAYVGGGFSTGLHNTLEPAAFGIPIIIGPRYQRFKEAQDLVNVKGIYPVSHIREFNDIFTKMLTDESFRKQTGTINAHYVEHNLGATEAVLQQVNMMLENTKRNS